MRKTKLEVEDLFEKSVTHSQHLTHTLIKLLLIHYLIAGRDNLGFIRRGRLGLAKGGITRERNSFITQHFA